MRQRPNPQSTTKANDWQGVTRRSAMISRCSDSRDRIMNRSEWSSEKTTDATKRGYRRTSITSIEGNAYGVFDSHSS